MAAGYRVVGVGEAAARLPSAVAALLLVLVQYAFARWAFGRDVAWRAGLILLLSLEYVAIGRMALTDATLALWTSAAGYSFLRGWWAPLRAVAGPWPGSPRASRRSRRVRWDF
jgi:4-amino-4-deoxy-L-arabinose transferase-like glycosyltransferase